MRGLTEFAFLSKIVNKCKNFQKYTFENHMADEVSNGHVKRPKDHLQVVTPLNILLIDCDDPEIIDVFDGNRFTVYCGQLEENYVSTFLTCQDLIFS